MQKIKTEKRKGEIIMKINNKEEFTGTTGISIMQRTAAVSF
jgi:hypothetical protein